jgi:PPOX class probable F420-dependent enzyme
MRLTEEDARARLLAHGHGVLGTRHPVRGVDAVPVVYAVDADGHLGVPIDRVKPKSTTALQRVRNLDADPRATLLIDHWDAADWSRLWWVRVALQWLGVADADREARLATLLAERYSQYRDRPFDRVLVFRITGITGWSAVPPPPPAQARSHIPPPK